MVVERQHSTGVLLQFFFSAPRLHAWCLSATVSPAGNDEITSDSHRQEEHAYIQAKDPNVYNKQNLFFNYLTLFFVH